MPLSFPAIPVVEKIKAAVVTALGTVTTGAGYHQTLTVEEGKPRLGNPESTTSTYRVVVLLGDDEILEPLGQQYDEFSQEIYIVIHVVEPDSSSYSADTRLSVVAADIRHVLTNNATAWRQDGWAFDTNYSRLYRLEAQGINEAQGALEMLVKYRHTTGNPYESPFRS